MTAEADLLRTRVAGRLDVHRQAQHEVRAHILLMKRARERELASDSDHSREWLEKRRDEIRAEALKALEQIEAAEAEATEEAKRQALEATAKPTGSVQEQLLEAMLVQNAWLSVRQILDAAADQADGLSAIEAACTSAAADPIKLQALRQFSGDWLTANFSKLNSHQQENIRAAMAAGIERVEASQRTPLQAAGHELVQEIERGQARMAANSSQVRQEIASYDNSHQVAALAAWGDDHILLRDQRGEYPEAAVSAAFSARARAWAIAAQRNYPRLAGQPTADDRRVEQFAQLGMNISQE